jgi:hypothetical protein
VIDFIMAIFLDFKPLCINYTKFPCFLYAITAKSALQNINLTALEDVIMNQEHKDSDNLHELFTADREIIVDFFQSPLMRGRQLHFTNGTYMLPAEKIVPTTLAGFEYLNDRVCGKDDVFVIAINSNASMQNIADQKNWNDEDRAQVEIEQDRAYKVALPLAEAFPDRHVVVLFYDEDTPTFLYDTLAEADLFMGSLHKWGYGTDPNAPRIEGAYNFGNVYAFPMPNDEKPVCHDITFCEDQSHFVHVVRLTDRFTLANQPYILPNGQLPAPL